MFEASIITLKLFGSMGLLFVVILGSFIMVTRVDRELEAIAKDFDPEDDK